MGKGAKKKHLYDDDDRDCGYLVISNPWGMDVAGRRTQAHVDNVGAWLERMFNGRASAEVVYVQDTKDPIIVQVPMEFDLSPFLGAHYWRDFLTFDDPLDTRVSEVFEYKWCDNGDPANHNWADKYPTSESPPSDFPVKIGGEYPRPKWAKPSPELRRLNLVLDLQRPRTPTPPPPEISFTPYEPPSHHPSHTRYPQPRIKEEDNVKQERQETPKVDKRDPYEEDELAQRLLSSSGSAVKKEEPGSVSVKAEHESSPIKAKVEPGYTPSQVLTDLIDGQGRRRPTHQEHPHLKIEPKSEYTPSRALEEMFDAEGRLRMAQAKSDLSDENESGPSQQLKSEEATDEISFLSASSPTRFSKVRNRRVAEDLMFGTATASVKSEPSTLPAPAFVDHKGPSGPTPVPPSFAHHGSGSMSTGDPRIPLPGGQFKRPKMEDESDAPSKKIKTGGYPSFTRLRPPLPHGMG